MNDKIEWVLVPREPTEAMWNAGKHFCDGHVTRAIQTYAAMLAFAPKPEAQAAGVDPSKMLRAKVRPGAAFGVAVIDVDCADFGPNTIGDGHEILIHNLTKNPLSAPASHDAQDGDHWSEFVVIERHWLQNIASAVCLLEQSESILDRREGAALRKLVASARSTPKPEAAAPTEPHSAYALRLLVAGRFVSQSKVDDAMKIARDLLPEAAGALTPAATPGEKEVKCRRCMDTQQEFNYNGDGPFPCRHCYDAQKEGNGNG